MNNATISNDENTLYGNISTSGVVFASLIAQKGGKGDTGATGADGKDGIDGKSLEYNWNGTELGIKQEGESEYQYVDLKGADGSKGDNGNDGRGVVSIIRTSGTGAAGTNDTYTITYTDGTTTTFTIHNGADGGGGSGSGDMLKSVYDTDNNGVVDNAEKVNNHTVESDVPSNAVFTDTTYTAGTGISIDNGVISNTQTSAEWGNITGTLANQTDLQEILNSKSEFSGDYEDLTNKPSLFSGNYNDLTNKPTIPTVPTNISAFTNDSGYITGYTETDPVFSASASAGITSTDITNWNNKSDFSGSYNDLTNKPTLFSGSYNDLTDTPDLSNYVYFSTEEEWSE